jgi:hypothetical protein
MSYFPKYLAEAVSQTASAAPTHVSTTSLKQFEARNTFVKNTQARPFGLVAQSDDRHLQKSLKNPATILQAGKPSLLHKLFNGKFSGTGFWL